MDIPYSAYALVAVISLSVFLAAMSFLFWSIQRRERASLWLAGWLVGSIVFAISRLLQYAPFNDPTYILLPHIFLSANYILVWVGYEFSNSFNSFRPRMWERILIISIIVISVILSWIKNLVLTDQVILRTVVFGGSFHGIQAGPLFVPVCVLIVLASLVAPIRLLRTSSESGKENRWLAAGFIFATLCSLVDMVVHAMNLTWLRLSDFAYLPLALFFSFIQVRRMGLSYRNMDSAVQQRAAELVRVSEEKRKAELQYKALVEQMPAIAYTDSADQVNHTFFINSQVKNILGYTPEEWQADDNLWFRIIHPDDCNRVVSEYNHALETGISFSMEYRLFARDGQMKWVRDEATLIKDPGGKPLFWQGVMVDTTEHKQVEYDFRSVYENAVLGIYRATAEGKILLANPSIIRMLGYDSFEDMARHDLEEENDEKNESRRRFHQLIETQGEIRGYEYGWTRKDGTIIYLRENARIVTDEYGKPLYYDGTIEDITELKQTRALQEAVYRIAVATETTKSLNDLYALIHQIIDSVMPAENFYIALFDREKDTVSFPYFQDERDKPYLGEMKNGKGLTAYVLRTGRSLLCTPEVHERLVQEGAVVLYGVPTTIWLGVPLVIEKQTIGVMVVQHYSDPNAYSEREQHMLEFVSSQVAFAITRKQAEEKILRQAEEMTALYQTTHDLVIEQDLARLLKIIVERATSLLSSPGGMIYLCEPEKKQIRCVVSLRTVKDYTGTILQYGEGMAGRIAETGKDLAVEDYRSWESRAAVFEEDQPFVSMLGVPMHWQGNIIGVIQLFENKIRQFQPADLRILSLFADQAAIAIENSRLLENERNHSQEADALATISRDLSSTLNLSDVINRIATYAKNLLDVETSAIYLTEHDSPYMRAISAIGPDSEQIMNDPLTIGEGILGSIAKARQGEMVNKAALDPRAKTVKGTEVNPVEHLMAVPVLLRDQLTGLIAVWRTSAGNEFKLSELNFLSRLASQVAVAIQNASLFENTSRRLAEIQAVHTVSTALRSAQRLDEALPLILNQCMSLLDGKGAFLATVDSAGEIVTELASGAWSNATGLRLPPRTGVSGKVIESSEPFVSDDILSEPKMARPELFPGLPAIVCVPVIAHHQTIGVLCIGRHTPILKEEVSLLSAIGEMVGNAIHRMRLHMRTEDLLSDLQVANRELSKAYDTTLEGWARALELQDKETENHSRRVTALTLRLARHLGITEPELTYIRRGVLLHDIGKMGISDQLLKKTAPLTEEEWVEMRKHPKLAYDLLHPITFLRPSLDIPYGHHERWDGSGYPRHLKGANIPFSARIFAVIDVYDALLFDRVYRAAWPRKDVLAYLQDNSGKLFDPHIVEAFMELISDKRLHLD